MASNVGELAMIQRGRKSQASLSVIPLAERELEPPDQEAMASAAAVAGWPLK
jgi:hypothetical protein